MILATELAEMLDGFLRLATRPVTDNIIICTRRPTRSPFLPTPIFGLVNHTLTRTRFSKRRPLPLTQITYAAAAATGLPPTATNHVTP